MTYKQCFESVEMYDNNYRLAKNISLGEFTYSPTAIKYGIENKPDLQQIYKMEKLSENNLQKARDNFNSPLIITSGFRCRQLNSHDDIGGSNRSQHTKGEAADFHILDVDPRNVFLWIINNLEFDQIIDEFGLSWIHISYKRKKNRNSILRSYHIRKGKTTKTKYAKMTKDEAVKYYDGVK